MYIQMKVRPGITLEHEVWKKFKEKYDGENSNKNASQRANELLKKDLEMEEQTQEVNKPFEDLPLTSKQKQLFSKVLEKEKVPIGKSGLGSLAISNNIYSRRDHIKNAVQALGNNDEVPLRMKGSKLIGGDLSCSCGASIPLKAVLKKGFCPNCDLEFDFSIS